jgi:hypothetical protein
VAEPVESEHDVQLEFPQKVAFGHISYTNAYFDGDAVRKVAGAPI